ncbi:MAG: site-2 protease family protein [Prevotella sp.]|nr:site-2 protease family protein [Prevotella sp.]
MFELRIGNLTAAFDFSFFAAVSLLMLIGDNRYALFGLAACIWHELGHLAVMRLCGISVKRLVFYGAGIKIVPDKQLDFTPFRAQLAVYLAGSFANFLAAALLWFSESPAVRIWAAVNAVIGAFNLLPLQYLDGGKIIASVIRCFCEFSLSCRLEQYLKRLNLVLILAVLITFAALGRGNFTLYLTLCCLLVSVAI